MLRLIDLGLFLVPFAAFFAWLRLSRTPGPAPLTLAAILGALALLGAGLVWFALHEGAPRGSAYVPAHLQDGQIVPGGFQPR